MLLCVWLGSRNTVESNHNIQLLYVDQRMLHYKVYSRCLASLQLYTMRLITFMSSVFVFTSSTLYLANAIGLSDVLWYRVVTLVITIQFILAV